HMLVPCWHPRDTECAAWTANAAHINYADLLAGSRFALIPEGAGSHSYRLLEALHAGAVPVVLGDALLPLPHVIPWDSISIREVDTSVASLRRLLGRLKGIPLATVTAMQQRGQQVYYNSLHTLAQHMDGMIQELAWNARTSFERLHRQQTSSTPCDGGTVNCGSARQVGHNMAAIMSWEGEMKNVDNATAIDSTARQEVTSTSGGDGASSGHAFKPAVVLHAADFEQPLRNEITTHFEHGDANGNASCFDFHSACYGDMQLVVSKMQTKVSALGTARIGSGAAQDFEPLTKLHAQAPLDAIFKNAQVLLLDDLALSDTCAHAARTCGSMQPLRHAVGGPFVSWFTQRNRELLAAAWVQAIASHNTSLQPNRNSALSLRTNMYYIMSLASAALGHARHAATASQLAVLFDQQKDDKKLTLRVVLSGAQFRHPPSISTTSADSATASSFTLEQLGPTAAYVVTPGVGNLASFLAPSALVPLHVAMNGGGKVDEASVLQAAALPIWAHAAGTKQGARCNGGRCDGSQQPALALVSASQLARIAYKIQAVLPTRVPGRLPTGSSSTAEQQLRPADIGIVTLCAYDPRVTQLGILSRRNMMAYCQAHGYGCVFEEELVDKRRPAAWSKVRACHGAQVSTLTRFYSLVMFTAHARKLLS
ncbi:MAG: hypothetical protein EOO65_02040, partial [Methanosarcinales archaeon]